MVRGRATKEPAGRPRARVGDAALVERRRAQIVEAASRLVARQGFAKTVVRDIADEANISVGLVYEYVRSKELWQGMVDEYGGERTLIGEDGESHRRLRELLRRGYSREAVKGRCADLVESTDRSIDRDWRPGASVPSSRKLIRSRPSQW